jgi:hypothetical protein
LDQNINQGIRVTAHKRAISDLVLGYIGVCVSIALMEMRRWMGRVAYLCRPSAELMIMAAAVAMQGGFLLLFMRYLQR